MVDCLKLLQCPTYLLLTAPNSIKYTGSSIVDVILVESARVFHLISDANSQQDLVQLKVNL